ncbi:hypothetical protein KQH54_02735 [bacterium]|nr:hypothetical protein [bacterium]
MTDQKPNSSGFLWNVLWKAALLFIILNVVFIFLPVEDQLGKFSLYNSVYPGRWRFSWSENPSAAYSVSTNQLDALFSSHEVSVKPVNDEYRVFVFGDSSVWGFLLPKEDTLTALINQLDLKTVDGRSVRAYNLGYPTISLTKDLLLIDQSMAYEPDMIVWFVTLEAFPVEKQIFTPLVQENPAEVRALIEDYQLSLDAQSEGFVPSSWIDKTIYGQRRPLADLLRLQIYGVLWSATGVDQDLPDSYTPLQVDYEADDSYYDFSPPKLGEAGLSWDVLEAGVAIAGDVPVLIVNEPIYISSGENSDIRYNFFYPRWAYDDYRSTLESLMDKNGWNYLDLWDTISPGDFTNTAIHVNAEGSGMIVEMVAERISLIAGQ